MRNQWQGQVLGHVTKCWGRGEGPNFGNAHTHDSRTAWPSLFKLYVYYAVCTQRLAKRRLVAGLWSRDQMMCVRGWRHIFDSPRAVAHPGIWWVLVVISITALLLNLVLYVVCNKCSCHGASSIEMGTPVTNNVGDSRCHGGIIRTTDTVRIRIEGNNVWTDRIRIVWTDTDTDSCALVFE